jgi:hypothetical protein
MESGEREYNSMHFKPVRDRIICTTEIDYRLLTFLQMDLSGSDSQLLVVGGEAGEKNVELHHSVPSILRWSLGLHPGIWWFLHRNREIKGEKPREVGIGEREEKGRAVTWCRRRRRGDSAAGSEVDLQGGGPAGDGELAG